MTKASVSALEAANADQAKKLQIAQNRIRQLETELDELKRNAVVLPCEIGAQVWLLLGNRSVKGTVEQIRVTQSDSAIFIRFGKTSCACCPLDKVGKEVFFCEETAKNALAERIIDKEGKKNA